MIEIFLPIVPPKTTHQAKRIVRIGKFTRLADKPELKEAINSYMSLLLPYAPDTPISGPVSLTLRFTFPWRKSETKKRRMFGILPMTVKPDFDNMAKTITDVMTKLNFWRDDAQVARAYITKQWGDDVGIRIKIEEIKIG